jgi:hypothetical protein
MKPEFSRQIFEKVSNNKYHKNPSSDSRVVPCGQTDSWTDGWMDGHDKANRRFSQISESA